ncbi:hypothetical protein EV361DRAFT_807320 [Lentinula raphanica]|uniref:Uncharacterized protein n=1 Tax=Lentinula raphanica TaxID=153919 RepID=A0AA38PCJ2_9AGAR|nr:hypothetical protein C8R42DRAFT_683465 [Lentinula raphanica]KAJ3766730.1 hypothetical protein FB446DRAFT_767321 [Lentinula raphanica]KAJ3822466.1 hypothetical protein F5880DRAFT_1484029 [Lentinula raphanica]KAJ3840412.1 hypothetical protein F5878DRAFT_659437 [Lentinula raphanica]KAJ3967408.1 hypothetical protein EV361DRAFT_807320 [Lentinula raphanica]
MYNSPITNNPFISDPTNAQSRYPDLSLSSPSPDLSSSQFTSWLQPGGSQQQYQQQQFQQQMPPQLSVGYQATGFGDGSGYMGPYSNGSGQQMTGQMTGGSYSYLLGQNPSIPAQTGYNPVQQQIQSPGYHSVAQFDPLSSTGISSSAPQQSASFQTPMSPISPTTPVTTSRSVTGAVHPREYVRTHKAEIESWDAYAWKQLLNTFDDLKEAWALRKKEVEGRAQQLLMQMRYSAGYHPQMQQESERLQALSKEADLNHDSVAASSFQIHEVFKGYRQSGDAASKRRVREASNAALQSIPDWPAPTF